MQKGKKTNPDSDSQYDAARDQSPWPPEGMAKVQRGGSYINSPYRLRASFRTKGDPTEHDPHVGFRCAQDVPALPEGPRADRP